MRAVIQRVSEAKVEIDGKINGEIGKGFLVLIAVHNDDEISDIDYMVNKISKLRVFEDDEGKMNLSLTDIGGELLIVSQFTLYGDSRKGNRPSFIHSAKPPKSVEYYDRSASYVYYFHSAIGEFCAEEGYYYADSGEPQA